jgi:hypothetical protein
VLMVLKGEPGFICLMCCNADILFCVLVLHWVSNKEPKEGESAFRSASRDGCAAIGPVGVGMVGSGRARSWRVSLAKNKLDDVETSKSVESKSSKTAGTTVHPLSHSHTPPYQPSEPSLQALDTALRMPATIVTECKAVPAPSGIVRVLHRRGSSWEGNARPGTTEDEVELNNIRVQIIQTREVEGERSESESSLGATDEWMAGRKGVVGERMV